MPVINFEYTEGTIANPQHTKSSEGCFLVEGTNMVHFPDGRLTPIPAFIADESADGEIDLVGSCRAIYSCLLNTTNYSGAHYLFGTHVGLYDEYFGQRYNVTPLVSSATATLSTDPLDASSGDETLTVNYTAHGLSAGDRIKLAGATDFAGLTAASSINIEHIVATVVDADSFTVEMPSAASSTASGGGAAVAIFKQIAAGNQYQEFFSGYGADYYGTGDYGTDRFSTAAFGFPRIWSFDVFGNDVVMCPGDYDAGDGQKIYIWDGNNTVAPTVLANAPTNCNWVLVVNNAVVALCGTDIRISEIGDATVWTGITAETFPIERTDRLLSGFPIADKTAIIFAPDPYLLWFEGGEWGLVELGREYSIVAPQAACRLNDGLVWYGKSGHFHYFDGSNVKTWVNNQNGEYVRRRISQNNIWVTHMFSDPRHNQAWLYYPSSESRDPDSYVIVNPRLYRGNVEPSFTTGTQTRTAAQRPNILNDAFYMTDGDVVYSSFTAQPVSFAWSAKTSFFFFDGESRYMLRQIQPDSYQEQSYSVRFFGKEEAQTAENDFGSFTVSPTSASVAARCGGKAMSMQFSGMYDMMLGSIRLVVSKQGRRTR